MGPYLREVDAFSGVKLRAGSRVAGVVGERVEMKGRM